MQYLSTIDLTTQVAMLLSKGALRLQPGQWVRHGERNGRYLRTNRRTGTNYVSWVRPGDDWKTQASRFHRACVKGYVGRHGASYVPKSPAPDEMSGARGRRRPPHDAGRESSAAAAA